MFVHDVVAEVVVCGETAIDRSNFAKAMLQLRKINSHTGQTNLHTQFQVLQPLMCCLKFNTYVTWSTGLAEAHSQSHGCLTDNCCQFSKEKPLRQLSPKLVLFMSFLKSFLFLILSSSHALGALQLCTLKLYLYSSFR